MTYPQGTPEDVQEQQLAVVEEPAEPDGALPEDAPDADVAEQRLEITLDEEDTPIG
jgi:hypothetical protein